MARRRADVLITPPYRVETERLVLRCWEPRDAPLLKEAVDSSLDHLRPWMPWAAHEPQTLDEKVELLRRFRGLFDRDEDYVYAVFSRDETQVVGGSGLHTRVGDDALEIGYWIRSSAVRNGFATEVTAALTRIAFELCGVDRVEIRVEPSNRPSLPVPRKLGFTEEATLRRRLLAGDGDRRDAVVFTLFADAFPMTPSAGATFAAYDAAGRRIAVTNRRSAPRPERP